MIPRSTTTIRTEALEVVREHCKRTGKKVTDFISQAAVKAANQEIAEHTASAAAQDSLLRKAHKRTQTQARSLTKAA